MQKHHGMGLRLHVHKSCAMGLNTAFGATLSVERFFGDSDEA